MDLVRLVALAMLATTVGVTAAEPATQPADPPVDFLKVESKAWNRWLDEPANTTWTRIPLKSVMDGVFGTARITVEPDRTMETPITFDAGKLSRRTALWRMSRQFGFTVRWEQREEPRMFMGVLETEHQEKPIGGIVLTTMTHVMRADYSEYQESKQAGKITVEETHDSTVYYARDIQRDLHFEHASALVTVVERYKTTIPPKNP